MSVSYLVSSKAAALATFSNPYSDRVAVLVRLLGKSVVWSITLPHWRHSVLAFPKRVRNTVEDWARLMELHTLRRSTKCTGVADSYWRFEHEVVIACGDWDNGQMQCPRCHRISELEYPQGWAYYPGDTCRHGVYVGGCGVDHMCGRCEAGE